MDKITEQKPTWVCPMLTVCRKTIQDAWLDFSAEYALKTEDGKFTMSDLREAFYRGIETIQNGNC